jgi:tetratricopeptide (TPR) repeat protein
MLKKLLAKKFQDKNLKYSFIITLCFIVVIVCIYFTRDLNYSREYLLQKANEYYSHEEYFRAARYFAKAMELNISDPQIYKKYGNSLLKLGNYTLAIEYFRLASSVDFYDADAYYFLGDALYRKALETNDKEAFIKSVEYIEKGIELNPDSEKLYLLAGLCCRKCGFYEKARSFYNKALTSDKFSKASLYNLIGNTFEEEGNYKDATLYYEKAVSHDDSFALAFCSKGDMFLKIGNYESALENYQKAIEIDVNFMLPYIKMANIYYDKNNFRRAAKQSLKVLKVNPEDNIANYILGMSYKQIGNDKKSLEYLKKAAFYGNDNAVKEIKRLNVL